jgi:hypothetical protein
MFKKYISLVLATLLVHASNAAPAYAQSAAGKDVRFAEEVKENILMLGVGPAARVRIKLRDKAKLDGYVSQAGTDSFTVIGVRTGTATAVPYAQVKQVRGSNYLTGVSIGVGLGKPPAILMNALGVGILVCMGIYIVRTGGF